jgi:transposase
MQKAEFVSRAVDIDAILPLPLWESFRSILPEEKNHPKGGVAPISSRNVIAAMIYLEHHHRPWAQVPVAFGVSRRTMAGRRQEWKRLGIWDSVWSIVLDLAASSKHQ